MPSTSEIRNQELGIKSSAAQKAERIHAALPTHGLFADKEWRISPDPFAIEPALYDEFEKLGNRLSVFYRACDLLYRQSLNGQQPSWIAEWLDIGKPAELLKIARDSRFQNDIPRVIRPDILLTEEGWKITELDSVPGGIGLTGWFQKIYNQPKTMVEQFARTFSPQNENVAIVISEESAVYRPEMEWLIQEIQKISSSSWAVCGPDDLESRSDGVYLQGQKIDLIYRFFELFDLPNLKNISGLIDQVLQGQVQISAPLKPALEEKMLLALFWLKPLENFWRQELGEENWRELQKVIPHSWVVHPLSPSESDIPGLNIKDWNELKKFSQKKRRLALKLSGFSPLAWGGRSIRIGHDLSTEDWSKAVDHAVESFPKSPYILQRFEKGRRVEVDYFDFQKQQLIPMQGRVRLCPFYYCQNHNASLQGILATICPPDKKVIHGMRDAVMTLAIAKGSAEH